MTSLYHQITDVDNLQSYFEGLDGTIAIEVDGVTKEEYRENLEKNFSDDLLYSLQFKEKTGNFERNLKDRLKGLGLDDIPIVLLLMLLCRWLKQSFSIDKTPILSR